MSKTIPREPKTLNKLFLNRMYHSNSCCNTKPSFGLSCISTLKPSGIDSCKQFPTLVINFSALSRIPAFYHDWSQTHSTWAQLWFANEVPRNESLDCSARIAESAVILFAKSPAIVVGRSETETTFGPCSIGGCNTIGGKIELLPSQNVGHTRVLFKPIQSVQLRILLCVGTPWQTVAKTLGETGFAFVFPVALQNC